jgi:predicted TPR repeat methyltransferase
MINIQEEIKKFFDKLDLKEYSIPVNIQEMIWSRDQGAFMETIELG